MLASQAADNEFLRRRLPPEAREKLLHLLGQQDAITAAFGQLQEQTSPLRRRLQIAEGRLAELERLPLHAPVFMRDSSGFRYEPPGPQREASLKADRERIVGAARDERDGAREELARLDERGADLRRRLSPVAARTVGWLRGLPDGTVIRMHDGPAPSCRQPSLPRSSRHCAPASRNWNETSSR